MEQVLHIIGKLGTAPTSRVHKGTKYCNFNVWVYNKSGNLWVRVTCTGDNVNNHVKYLKKNSMVSVRGGLIYDLDTGAPRMYEDKEKYAQSSFEMWGNSVTYLDPPTKTSKPSGKKMKMKSKSTSSSGEVENEPPF